MFSRNLMNKTLKCCSRRHHALQLQQPARQFSSKPKVNSLYQPGIPLREPPAGKSAEQCTKTPCICLDKKTVENVLKTHKSSDSWSTEKLKDLSNKHVMMTWGATNPMLAGATFVTKAEGIYIHTSDGKKLIDFNSGAMCANLGHTIPKQIQSEIDKQLASVPYFYPGMGVVDIRAKLAKLLSDIVPGDINSFLFPSTGMESNETAMRLARNFTGRHKILSRYRSYHGASMATSAMTGDFRRFPAENGVTGHVHFFDPYPYSFKWGETEEEVTQKSLQYLRETVAYEGGHTIAAIYMESITGTNGILKPPKGYLEGVREICDEHGIMMVCDEVMVGFGRSGKLFGWCHADVVPDLFTGAKGINGAYLPLGVVGMRDKLAQHFREHPTNIGSTYNSHPVSVASAYAALQYMLENEVIQNAANLEPLMIERLQRLVDNHASVKQARVIGLFGCFDLQKNLNGDFNRLVSDPLKDEMIEFKSKLIENGVLTMMRGHNVFTNPPLIINADEINQAFDGIEKALPILDAVVEK